MPLGTSCPCRKHGVPSHDVGCQIQMHCILPASFPISPRCLLRHRMRSCRTFCACDHRPACHVCTHRKIKASALKACGLTVPRPYSFFHLSTCRNGCIENHNVCRRLDLQTTGGKSATVTACPGAGAPGQGSPRRLANGWLLRGQKF